MKVAHNKIPSTKSSLISENRYFGNIPLKDYIKFGIDAELYIENNLTLWRNRLHRDNE